MSNFIQGKEITYVMVDYENVQPSISHFITHPQTHFIIFVGHQQDKIHYEIVSMLQSIGNRAEYVKIHGTGSNALDLHIAFFVGKIIQNNSMASFIIIFNDKGYDPLISYLKSIGTKIVRYSIQDISKNDKPHINSVLSMLSDSHSTESATTAIKRENHITRVINALSAMKNNKPKNRTGLGGVVKSTGRDGEINKDEIDKIVNVLIDRGIVNPDGKQFTYHLDKRIK